MKAEILLSVVTLEYFCDACIQQMSHNYVIQIIKYT